MNFTIVRHESIDTVVERVNVLIEQGYVPISLEYDKMNHPSVALLRGAFVEPQAVELPTKKGKKA